MSTCQPFCSMQPLIKNIRIFRHRRMWWNSSKQQVRRTSICPSGCLLAYLRSGALIFFCWSHCIVCAVSHLIVCAGRTWFYLFGQIVHGRHFDVNLSPYCSMIPNYKNIFSFHPDNDGSGGTLQDSW